MMQNNRVGSLKKQILNSGDSSTPSQELIELLEKKSARI